MGRRVGAAPGANRARRMKVIFPALPRRAGSASTASVILIPKPGRRASHTSLRWPRGAGEAPSGTARLAVSCRPSGLLRVLGYGWAT